MALPTPYFPLQLANNLRFNDLNGNLVTQLYSVAPTQLQDNPTTGYISLIGSRLSSTLDTIDIIESAIGVLDGQVTALELAVAQILASGATAIPQVNGGCLNGDITTNISTVTDLLVTNSCDYNEALGTPSQLAAGVAALDTSALNVLPCYSNPGAPMASLVGWISNPLTTAELTNNLALAYLDIRVGVTQALNQSAITCADIVINTSSSYDTVNRIITIYFPGSSIPGNFSDNGSSLLVEDTAGNQYTANWNVITSVVNDGFLTIDINASTLLQTSAYTVSLTYDTISTVPSLGCSNIKIVQVENTTTICPNVNVWSTTNTVSFTFVPPITTNVQYVVDLLDSSGTTVLDTKNFVNPTSAIVDTFLNLSSATSFYVRVTTIVAGVPTICSLHGIITA